MKQISEDQRTHRYLESWAGTATLHIGRFFFWNQGTELQKSRTGLRQSLLYQILRAAPHLIPSKSDMVDWLEHESWDIDQLIALFKHVAGQDESKHKYCFFVDGLDEYHRNDGDIVPMLEVLQSSSHVKICASSRPGRIYEPELRWSNTSLDIAMFTKDDMQRHVNTTLMKNAKFNALASREPDCGTILDTIVDDANGVWLWVALVTRDILFQVKHDEGVGTLQRILRGIPGDLDEYFELIIRRIHELHKEEMAQIFLATVHELQPLPLYAFALLEKERQMPGHVLRLPIQFVSDESLEAQYPTWRSRVQNRCGDLLVVDDGPHPVYLSHSVDFFHRTVRDFLRDCYRDELQSHPKTPFQPLSSFAKSAAH
jgi:hypothetical protein